MVPTINVINWNVVNFNHKCNKLHSNNLSQEHKWNIESEMTCHCCKTAVLLELTINWITFRPQSELKHDIKEVTSRRCLNLLGVLLVLLFVRMNVHMNDGGLTKLIITLTQQSNIHWCHHTTAFKCRFLLFTFFFFSYLLLLYFKRAVILNQGLYC